MGQCCAIFCCFYRRRTNDDHGAESKINIQNEQEDRAIKKHYENPSPKPSSIPKTLLSGKKIIVIGETGTGKSAFLNQLANTLEENKIHQLEAYFKLENSDITAQINIINDIRIKTESDSEIVNTKSIEIIKITTSSTNETYFLIDTPGIVCKRDNSIDEQFIKIMNELFSVIENIDILLFFEKSDRFNSPGSVKSTISELFNRFSNKIGKVLPIFTFYPQSLNFHVENLPFPKEKLSENYFKINNTIFSHGLENLKKKPEKFEKMYQKLSNKMKKIISCMKDNWFISNF